MDLGYGFMVGLGDHDVLGTITVGATSQIVLSPSTRSVDPTATTSTVTATPKDVNGHTTADVVVFHSSATSVATINSSTGVITWVGAGTTNITATFSAVTSNTCVLTAASHGATSQVVMSPTTLSLPAGTTSTVTGTAKDSLGNATGDTVTYSSNNTPVATVNSSTGLVTWVSAGTVTITATSGAFSATCVVTAAAAGATVQLASVPTTLSLAHGVTGSALAGTAKDVNAVTTTDRKYWHSSDVTIVTVDPDTGVPTGVAAGSATITVNFVAPVTSDEPLYVAGVSTLLHVGDASNAHYASATAAGASDGDLTTRFIPHPSPIFNGGGVNTTATSIVTGKGGSGKAVRISYPLANTYGQDGGWATWNAPHIASGTATRVWRRQIQFNGTYTGATATKFQKLWELGAGPGGGYPQWSIDIPATNAPTPATGITTIWEAYPSGITDDANAYPQGRDQGAQPNGPYFQNMLGDGLWHRFTFLHRCSSTIGARDGRMAMWIDSVKVMDVSVATLNVQTGAMTKQWCGADVLDALSVNLTQVGNYSGPYLGGFQSSDANQAWSMDSNIGDGDPTNLDTFADWVTP